MVRAQKRHVRVRESKLKRRENRKERRVSESTET